MYTECSQFASILNAQDPRPNSKCSQHPETLNAPNQKRAIYDTVRDADTTLTNRIHTITIAGPHLPCITVITAYVPKPTHRHYHLISTTLMQHVHATSQKRIEPHIILLADFNDINSSLDSSNLRRPIQDQGITTRLEQETNLIDIYFVSLPWSLPVLISPTVAETQDVKP